MSKFWKFVNKGNGNAEILIYGNIGDERSWFGNETAPDGFAEELQSLDGCPLTIRINSSGGSVFAAHAIHNLIKAYAGPVTVIIDGIAASAASIIAVAAKKIIMPANSMMMIHDPMVALKGYHNAEELKSYMDALTAIKDSIVSAYLGRSKVSAEALSKMMKDTTWLTAKECLNLGFADEIVGQVDAVLDGNVLVVNQIQHQLSEEDAEKIKNKLEVKAKMNENNAFNAFWQHICAKLGIPVTGTEGAANAATSPENVIKPVENGIKPTGTEPKPAEPADAVAAERNRLLALEAVDNGNEMIHKVVDYAKKNGQTAEEIKPYLDIINGHKEQAPDMIKNLISDNKDSGVDNVTGQPGSGMSEEEKDRIQADNMANIMKKLQGGAR
ncbi:MAG: Clp protease ClpP [Acidaminococcaceae bacterium]|nr:Clp protease ClpP [Acidaminococcaceae bacterium]